jgi:hypothetical protein
MPYVLMMIAPVAKHRFQLSALRKIGAVKRRESAFGAALSAIFVETQIAARLRHGDAGNDALAWASSRRTEPGTNRVPAHPQ